MPVRHHSSPVSRRGFDFVADCLGRMRDLDQANRAAADLRWWLWRTMTGPLRRQDHQKLDHALSELAGGWAALRNRGGIVSVARPASPDRHEQLAPPERALPPGPTPSVTIVIAAKDDADALEDCVRQIRALDYPDFQVLLVDSSADPVPARELAARNGFDYLRCKAGFADVRNAALAHAATDWVAVLDDQSLPRPDWLRELVGPVSDPACRCVCGLTIPSNLEKLPEAFRQMLAWSARTFDDRTFDARFLKSSRWRPAQTRQISSGSVNLLLNRGFIQEIGGWRDDLAAGVADADLFHRILRGGGTIHRASHAVVFDQTSWSQRALRRDVADHAASLAVYHLRCLFAYRDYRSLLELIWHTPLALLRGLKRSLAMQSPYPFTLVLLEMRATLTGPYCYIAAKIHRRINPGRKPVHKRTENRSPVPAKVERPGESPTRRIYQAVSRRNRPRAA